MAPGMRKFCVILALVAAFAAPRLHAQTLSLPEHFGEWTESANATATPQAPADVLKEAGFTAALAKAYSLNGKTLNVALYEYRDPSSAYEIYTEQLNMGMLPSTIGNNTGVDHAHIVALAGNRVLEISPPQAASAGDLVALLKIVREHADRTPLPPIREYLPEGFSDGTQRYALGPAGFTAALNSLHRSDYAKAAQEVGFANGAEAMLADYRRGQDSAVLLLIEYPTPSLAEQQIHHLETALPAGTKVTRRASLLSLVLGASSEAFATNLQNAVNYETQVTWNEGKHVLTDPPWVVILGRIFLATAVFLIAAAVLGLVYGGIRITAKILWPGKVFDRPKSTEVLQLGITKQVDTKDFY